MIMRDWVILGILAVCVWASALLVAYTKFVNQQLFAELQALEGEKDKRHVEWTQLLLEQSTWAQHHRIEKMAAEKLKMRMPEPLERQVIRDDGTGHITQRTR